MSKLLTKTPRDTVGHYFGKSAVEFDGFYDKQRNRFMRWVDRTFRFDMFERFHATFRALGPLSGKTVLDVGCGSGPYVEEALQRSAEHVTGIDLAGPMIELAKRRVDAIGAAERCTLSTGAFPFDLPVQGFDFAIVMGVMDYVEDPISFLRALAARVTDRAVLSFPSTHWFRTPVRKVRYRVKRCPVFFYDAARIEQVMLEAGFASTTVEKIKGAGMDFVAIGKMRRSA